ncbi:hypothetical protein L7F22_048320 [Adiantum nelumboides]|nr:hypothetical protein [Adiantum nelumboides]
MEYIGINDAGCKPNKTPVNQRIEEKLYNDESDELDKHERADVMPQHAIVHEAAADGKEIDDDDEDFIMIIQPKPKPPIDVQTSVAEETIRNVQEEGRSSQVEGFVSGFWLLKLVSFTVQFQRQYFRTGYWLISVTETAIFWSVSGYWDRDAKPNVQKEAILFIAEGLFCLKFEGARMSIKGAFPLKVQCTAKADNADQEGASAEWELRPCGMLVQKRDPEAEAAHAGPVIRIKVCFGRSSHRVSVNAHSTFGDLKKLLVQLTGLQTKQQRLTYKGKAKSDTDYLSEAGVKDKSKLVLVEDTKGWEKTLIELRKSDADAKSYKAVAEVQQLVDQISGQIAALEAAVSNGRKLADNELVGPSDLLMCQLIKLDDSKVDGDTKVQKRILIRRVQKYVETLDALKVRNDVLRSQNGSMKKLDSFTNGRVDALSPRTNGRIDASSPQTNGRIDPSILRTNVTTARTESVKLRADTPSSHSTTVVTTTWETFGSSTGSVNGKSAPPASEPLLIQWD